MKFKKPHRKKLKLVFRWGWSIESWQKLFDAFYGKGYGSVQAYVWNESKRGK